MFRLNVSFIFLCALVIILAACGNQAATPQAVVPPPPTATIEIVQQAKANTPTPVPANTPTVAKVVVAESPTSTPTEMHASQGNPDLSFAQVVFVSARQNSDGLWQFDTTVRHNDEGWDHYADAWQVIDLDGNLLAERVLLHPHDTEQPFTRSQSSIEIPAEQGQVVVRAKCNVHGFGGQEVWLDLTMNSGENFEVSKP